ncbi:hypothetical protein AAVH_12534 [Aphelenchoides avenae]|nr:hypothetical protein AAVH_40914 [Aphelenchus avenae]KAH7720002.1 hypothetical protein AAVH_12534 [Aphelenchus avenae]
MNTKREKPVVEVDGYLMRQHQPNANGMLMLWRCADVNKYKYRARGSSLIDSRGIGVTTGHNGHLPDPSLATRYHVNTEVKAAAKTNILIPSGQLIYHHTAGLNGEELNKHGRRSGIQKVVNRARKHAEGSAVDRSPEHIRFTQFFKQTKDHQQFLRIDSREAEPNSPVFFAFASPSGLAQLQRERRYSMDGTFFSAPRHMAQVYVIGIHKGRSFLPCAFFLLPGKDEATYRRALTALFTLPELRDADPSSITCDFETAPRNVMQKLFPNARIVQCQFHLAQCLIRHIQRDGLMNVYCNAEVRPLLRSLWALAFLPPEDVLEAYEGIVVSLNALVARDVIPQADVQRLHEFINGYFEKNFIRRFTARRVLVDPLFPIATWNEGWNRLFNQRFLRSKIKLSQFLLRLRDEEEQARQRIERAANYPAEAFRQRRRPKTIIRDGNIKALIEDYVALPDAQRNRAAMAAVLARIQHHLAS